jgi:hypothetical protein
VLVAFLLVVAGQAVSSGLLFRASFDKAVNADVAAGDPEPLVADGVQVQEVAGFRPNSRV